MLVGPGVRVAAAQDEALVTALAGVLMTEDRRAFDGAILGDAARHPDAVVRRRAALALGRLQDPAGTPMLLDLLADRDVTVQTEAAFALGLMGDPLALDRLRELALAPPDDERVDVQSEAATAILKLGGSDAIDFLRELLVRWVGPVLAGDEVPVPVRRALKESWRLGSDAPIDLLLQYAESRQTDACRWAVYALSRIGATAAASVFLTALNDSDAWVRSLSLRVLTADYVDSVGLGRAGVARRIGDLAGAREAHVRTNALRSLATYADPAFVTPALERVSDSDPNVRVQALTTLGRLGGEQAARVLTERVNHGPLAERHQALLGMARTARDLALIESAAWITDADWVMRAAGAEALSLIGGDTALAWSEGLTADPDGRVAAAGLTALGAIDSLRARHLARALIAHDDPAVRTIAANFIRAAPQRTDVELLVHAYHESLQDPISDARIAIVRALAAVQELGFSERVAVEDQFLNRFPTSSDHLVRRAAQDAFPAAAALWGPEQPVETGRDIEDYRDIARRLIVPAERDGSLPAVVIETERGSVRVRLFAADAPVTVDAMLRLADRAYFDGGRWHRVVPDFVIQAGDPRGDGWGGPGFGLRDELSRHVFEAGVVGVALNGRDTGGSQFFITHSRQPHLDGTYTVIGRVDAGLDVVKRVTEGDRIRRIRRG